MEAEPISERDVHALDSDRYVLRSTLGRGASATVYLADDLDEGRPVVVKLLSVSESDSESAIVRFHREIQSTRQLRHPNIIPIVDDGATSDQRPYLVTIYTPGRSLAAVLRETGRLSTSQAVDVAMAIADALAYVHSKDLVHRDLKPSNILIPGWPDAPDFRNPKLLDFGVAGRLEQGGHTQVGMIYGTLRYMSPEQIKGEAQSAATDVYGFGLLLFEMLAGRAPMKRGQDLTTLLIAIRDGVSDEDLKAVEPDLADLIRRCMRSDPSERPAMGVVLAELKQSPHRRKHDASAGLVTVSVDLPAPIAVAPAPAAASAASQKLTERTITVEAESGPAPPRSSSTVFPGVSSEPRSGNWLLRIGLAAAAAVLAVTAIVYFRPVAVAPSPVPHVSNAAPGEPNAPPTASKPAAPESNETAVRAVRFAAGLLLMVASVAIAFGLRTWLGSRSQVKSEALELVFGAQARTDLTATIALQLDDLVSKLRRLDERILAGTVALMLNEYGNATDTKDRQAALMNVVALSEKLAVRLSPWYERYKEIIASAVAVMGGVSGLMTAINSVLAHKH